MSNILKGSIVEVVEGLLFESCQGLVVCADSDIEGPEFCVAVFFNLEVSTHNFTIFERKDPSILRTVQWEEKYHDQCKRGEIDFLLNDDVWKKCPRVIFFRPEELIVQPYWKIENLAKRLFRNMFHTTHVFADYLPKDPSLHMCHLEDCQSRATKLALYNVWGSVYPLFVCELCFPKVNGWCGDDLPARKKTFLTFDGKPMLPPKDS